MPKIVFPEAPPQRQGWQRVFDFLLEQENPPEPPAVQQIRQDPAAIMKMAGMQPDPWQQELLSSPIRDTLVLCTRQAGKSTVAAGLALSVALKRPDSLVLIFAPTERQSGELLRKVYTMFRAAGAPLGLLSENVQSMELRNRSRVIALPGTETGIVGFSAPQLVIIDEAAKVPDSLYLSVRPMLAVSRGGIYALSTPFGKRGWFWKAWSKDTTWAKVQISADKCPRISPETLAKDREEMGLRWFNQEYNLAFNETKDSLFNYDDILRTIDPGVKPLEIAW